MSGEKDHGKGKSARFPSDCLDITLEEVILKSKNPEKLYVKNDVAGGAIGMYRGTLEKIEGQTKTRIELSYPNDNHTCFLIFGSQQAKEKAVSQINKYTQDLVRRKLSLAVTKESLDNELDEYFSGPTISHENRQADIISRVMAMGNQTVTRAVSPASNRQVTATRVPQNVQNRVARTSTVSVEIPQLTSRNIETLLKSQRTVILKEVDYKLKNVKEELRDTRLEIYTTQQHATELEAELQTAKEENARLHLKIEKLQNNFEVAKVSLVLAKEKYKASPKQDIDTSDSDTFVSSEGISSSGEDFSHSEDEKSSVASSAGAWKKVHVPSTFDCDECGKCFQWASGLSRHMTVKHKDKKYGYGCRMCHKTFDRSDNLRRHEKTHGNALDSEVTDEDIKKKKKDKKEKKENNVKKDKKSDKKNKKRDSKCKGRKEK